MQVLSLTETLSVQQLEFIAFDTETTGLSPATARLVELSGLKFSGQGQVISTFSTLIDPETPIPYEASQVHGISNDMVKGQPKYDQAIPAFFEWAGQGPTVMAAHNAQFDIGFIRAAHEKLNLPLPAYPVLDTLKLARRLLPEAPNHKLGTLIEYLKLESGGYHRALADSYHVRNLLLKLLPLIPQGHTWKGVSKFCGVMRFTQAEDQPCIPEEFASIQIAISSRAAVAMVYRGQRSYRRVVTPLSVRSSNGNVYMSAYCHTSCEERTFRLDKIESVELLEESLPAD